MPETQEDYQTDPPKANLSSRIVNRCADYVLDLFNQQGDARLTFHNFAHTQGIVQEIQQMVEAQQATDYPDEVLETALLAAWLRNTGFLFSFDAPEVESIRQTEIFLQKENYPEDSIQSVIQCIRSTRHGVKPDTPEAQLLLDAIHAYQYTAQYFSQSPLLRLEWELIQNRQLSNLDWNQIQLQVLLNTRFYTPYGKIHFAPILAQNLLQQKTKVEKNQRNGETSYEESGIARKYQDLERKLPSSATQTFFRTNYRNHINLSAIADNKANIMISVNAILISVLISLLTYQRNLIQANPMVLLPVVIFLFTGLASLIFAVLSIRPKVTSKNPEGTLPEIAKNNIVFFGNFVHLKLEEYEEAMDAMLRDGELIYGNMVRDLYFLGKVLDKKYRFLTLAYNTFMVGFIATVVMFMIAIFL